MRCSFLFVSLVTLLPLAAFAEVEPMGWTQDSRYFVYRDQLEERDANGCSWSMRRAMVLDTETGAVLPFLLSTASASDQCLQAAKLAHADWKNGLALAGWRSRHQMRLYATEQKREVVGKLYGVDSPDRSKSAWVLASAVVVTAEADAASANAGAGGR